LRQLRYWLAIANRSAFRTANRAREQLAVIDFPGVPSKVKVRDVPMEILSANVMERTVDASA